MDVEIELKFSVPADRRADLRRAVATATAQRRRLAAVYLDTPAQDLAKARIALRLRREGRLWVQTLKAEGATPLQRLEHNVPLAGLDLSGLRLAGASEPDARLSGDQVTGARLSGARLPAVDVARHDGTPAGDALRRVLRKAADPGLSARYATQVDRLTRLIRHRGAVIELALDVGRIEAGGRTLPLCELEFELLRGPSASLLDLAARWRRRFALVLDIRSKSERGERLAAGLTLGPPVAADRLALPPGLDAEAAVRAMLGAALSHTLANAALIGADGRDAEYLHQLRVGLRRMRNTLRVFGPALAPAGDAVGATDAAGADANIDADADADLLARMSALYARLGATRDRDVAAETLWPALREAGAPSVAWPAALAADVSALLGEPATQQLWLDLLARVWPAGDAAAADQPAAATPAPGAAAATVLRPALRRLQGQVRRDAARFDQLDDASRHQLRRRLKRLSDAAELSAALWPARRLARLLRRLQRARSALGDLNDTVMALDRYRSLTSQDGSLWFAVGWLSARRQSLLAPCAAALARLAALRPLWRKG